MSAPEDFKEIYIDELKDLWSANDQMSRLLKKIAPKAFIFGVTNPVMVQGAVFAGITITEGWTPHPREVLATGDWVRVDPGARRIEVLRRKS